MKRVIAIGLAALLASAGGVAQAGNKHHGGHLGGHHGGKHHARHNVYVVHDHRYHYRPHYGYYSYYPLGAALVGSAITYSLYHSHNGVRCYQSHASASYPVQNSGPEVMGCYRIERYPDGSERRVDLPPSECY